MRYRRDQHKEISISTHRIRRLGFFFTVFMALVLYRMLSFQVFDKDRWDVYSRMQYETRVKLIAKRGIIYDRDMNIVAADKPACSMAVDPDEVQNKEKTAEVLHAVLGGDQEDYLSILRKKGRFAWIEKDITPGQQHALEEAAIYGLIPVKGQKRGRPFGDLARQVIGITNKEHLGAWGVEQAFDDYLHGTNGWAIYQKDGKNREFSDPDYPVEPSVDGNHVVLTLDHVFQHILEEELGFGIKKYKAKGGAAVLMDPYTGDVLAMASILGERGRNHRTTFADIMQNRAVQVDFEPGSTFKIVTAAAALESGVFKPNTLVHCENGAYRVGGNVIRDDDRKFAWLTMSRVIEESSNIGVAKIVKKIGKKEFSRYIQNFGFGNTTGIQLPGEPHGIVRPYFQWGDFSTAAISFGQEVSVTPVQLAAMVSVIANGGHLMQPRIVSRILDTKGREIQKFPCTRIRRVIREETAMQIQSIMKGVVDRGSGKAAAVPGVDVAGKTGTAQKSKPGYHGYVPGAYTSSFVGFWPVHAPMFTLVVVLDEPLYLYWGSKSSAPTFGRIVEKISGLPETRWSMQDYETQSVQDVHFSSLEETPAQLPDLPETQQDQSDSMEGMPDLVGLTLRDALKRLAEIEVEARIKGFGIVETQTPDAGSRIEEGIICHLTCEFND